MSSKDKKKTLLSTQKTNKNAHFNFEKNKDGSHPVHSKTKTSSRPERSGGPSHQVPVGLSSIAGFIKSQMSRPKVHETGSFQGWLSNIQAGLFFVVGVAFLLFAGFFLFEKIFKSESLANFLPADNTVAYFELTVDKNAGQVKNFFNIMGKHKVYQTDHLIQAVKNIIPFDYAKDLEPWIGRKLGLALIKPPEQSTPAKLALFVEMRKINKTMDFLKSRILAGTGDELISESYKGFSLYHFKLCQNFNVLLLGNYAVFAENASLLLQIADGQLKARGKLKNDATYQKVANNLPHNALGFLFINTNKFFNLFLTDPLFQSQKTKDLLALQPFFKIFQAEGFVLLANGKNLNIQSFTSVDQSELNGMSYLTFSDKYKSQLLSLAGENPVLLAGGHNLHKELQRIQEILKAGTKASSVIFEGLLEAQKQKYFGKNVSIAQDFYPLLKNEYLITVDNNFEKPVINIFLEITDKISDSERFEKIINAFIKTGAIFSPHIQQVTLSDGTKGEEIVANTEEITRSSEQYENTNITILKPGNLPWKINYAFLDKILFVSTDLETLKNNINRHTGHAPTQNFTKTDYFQSSIKPLLYSADEFFHLKTGALTDILGLKENPNLKDFLDPFTNLAVTKNYFDDGISTIYLIDVL